MRELTYHPLERLRVLRPVDRVPYVARLCTGLRVLDLGALDETVIGTSQHRSWQWLHAEIAGTAREVLGVDSSENVRSRGRIETPFGTVIVHGRVEDLDEIVDRFRPDLVVAGELIEHTPDTAGWLARLGAASPGIRLVATTPNATSILNLLLAFAGRENQHEDHLHTYSYKTLATLAKRVGLRDASLTPYYYHSAQFRSRVPAAAVPLVAAIDRLLLRPVQWMFPLTAFGFILEGNLGGQGDAAEAGAPFVSPPPSR